LKIKLSPRKIGKYRKHRIITALCCGFLVVISFFTFQEQIPTISNTTKIYDREYINALRIIGNLIPENETLATNEVYPQVSYFTNHKVKIPRVESEKLLVQFMWRTNCSYLLIHDDTSAKPENTPLLIQLVEKPFEKAFDYYYDYISTPKPENTQLALDKLIKEKPFEKLFEKFFDYNTEGSILTLYRLRHNITHDNLDIVTDSTRPMLFLSSPANGTTMESESNAVRVHVTGIATDSESNIKKVEISVNGSPFRLTDPGRLDDWSTWSFSYIFTSEGVKRFVARATDNADNERRFPVYITIK
jgi:Bacterial Ig domain